MRSCHVMLCHIIEVVQHFRLNKQYSFVRTWSLWDIVYQLRKRCSGSSDDASVSRAQDQRKRRALPSDTNDGDDGKRKKPNFAATSWEKPEDQTSPVVRQTPAVVKDGPVVFHPSISSSIIPVKITQPVLSNIMTPHYGLLELTPGLEETGFDFPARYTKVVTQYLANEQKNMEQETNSEKRKGLEAEVKKHRRTLGIVLDE